MIARRKTAAAMLCKAILAMAINLHALAHTDGDENGLLQLQNKSTTSIVVVSGCMSNPEDSYSEDICTIAKKNFKTYCDYHGYKLVFYTQLPPGSEDRAPHWSKILAVRNILEFERVDYVFWMDSDSLFVNYSTSLKHYLPRGNSYMTFSGGDLFFLNSGHIMFKNDKWTLDFLKEVWKTYPSPEPWQDQSAMIYVMHKFSASPEAKEKATKCRDYMAMNNEDPEGCCNSKLVTGVDIRPHTELNALNFDREGLSIVHYAGRSPEDKARQMAETAGKLVDLRIGSLVEVEGSAKTAKLHASALQD